MNLAYLHHLLWSSHKHHQGTTPQEAAQPRKEWTAWAMAFFKKATWFPSYGSYLTGNGQGYLVNPGYLLDDTGYVNVTKLWKQWNS